VNVPPAGSSLRHQYFAFREELGTEHWLSSKKDAFSTPSILSVLHSGIEVGQPQSSASRDVVGGRGDRT
jgi:hypothetical protein